MKKFLSIFCPLVACEFSIATMFKLLHWPGGSILLLIALLLAIITIVCVLVYLLRQPEYKSAKIVSAIAVIVLLVGILFRLLHFPGGICILLVSLGVLIPAAVILCAIAFAQSK